MPDAPKPTTTSFAILGLLALRPWTTYELINQAARSMHFFWPRSEAQLYNEPKRLVRWGYATATEDPVGRRARTSYAITPAGRRALRAWLKTEPATPQLEIEGLVRLLHADHGSKDDLIAALRSTAAAARAERRRGVDQVREYLDDGGPFPERLHIIALLSDFYTGFVDFVSDWCAKAEDEVRSWAGTSEVGLTKDGRAMLEALLDSAAGIASEPD